MQNLMIIGKWFIKPTLAKIVLWTALLFGATAEIPSLFSKKEDMTLNEKWLKDHEDAYNHSHGDIAKMSGFALTLFKSYDGGVYDLYTPDTSFDISDVKVIIVSVADGNRKNSNQVVKDSLHRYQNLLKGKNVTYVTPTIEEGTKSKVDAFLNTFSEKVDLYSSTQRSFDYRDIRHGHMKAYTWSYPYLERELVVVDSIKKGICKRQLSEQKNILAQAESYKNTCVFLDNSTKVVMDTIASRSSATDYTNRVYVYVLPVLYARTLFSLASRNTIMVSVGISKKNAEFYYNRQNAFDYARTEWLPKATKVLGETSNTFAKK